MSCPYGNECVHNRLNKEHFQRFFHPFEIDGQKLNTPLHDQEMAQHSNSDESSLFKGTISYNKGSSYGSSYSTQNNNNTVPQSSWKRSSAVFTKMEVIEQDYGSSIVLNGSDKKHVAASSQPKERLKQRIRSLDGGQLAQLVIKFCEL